MGVVASFQLRRADRRMAKTLVFVKYAFAGDVTRLHEIMARDKVSPNAQDRFGMTALHWAAYGGKLACVQELIKAGASVELADANGRNALHHACRKDHDAVVRYLVTTVKMNVNVLSESKDTPLHKAVIGRSLRCIEVLLQCGADPKLRNDQNRTPLDELDTDPSVVKDVLPAPIPTARMQEELDSWRRECITEAQTSGRRRSSFERLMLSPISNHSLREKDSAGKKYAANQSVRDVENTLVTSFRARISEFSERTSSEGDLSIGSRPLSSHFVTKNLWAKPSASDGESLAFNSTASTGRRDSRSSGRTVVLPLNLQGLEPSTAAATATATPAADTPLPSASASDASTTLTTQRRRTLRYAGKRVIMAMRVKKCLSGSEKVEVIRLMLERSMNNLDGSPPSASPTGNPPTVQEDSEHQPPSLNPTSELVRASSGVRLSMPPNC